MSIDEVRDIIESFRDKEYRHGYSVAHTRELIAAQIREMRDSHNWNQSTLGEYAHMKQETISQLEDPDYGGYSLRTLQRLASAFDVHLSVRFEPFSRLVEYITNLEQSDLAVPGFDDDQGLAIGHTVDAVTEMATPIQLVVHSDIPLIHINAPVQIIEAGTVTKEQYSKVAPLYHQIAEDTTIGQYAYADAGGG